MALRRDKREDEFLENLAAAHVCAQRALDALYRENGPKRGFWYRRALGKAQNILIKLYIKEQNRREE